MVWEGIVPLVIEAENQTELSNKKKEDMDNKDLEDNIEKVMLEGNFSPKQIQELIAKHGKLHRRGKISSESTMQTRSHMLKSISK